jgi:hypothetical protein
LLGSGATTGAVAAGEGAGAGLCAQALEAARKMMLAIETFRLILLFLLDRIRKAQDF